MYTYDDYLDLYLRAVERGAALPRMGGALSPDIVPWGSVPDPDPDTLHSPPRWDEDPGRPLVPGVPNSIYLRCRNGGGKELPGHLFLAAGPACLPSWPDQLTPLATPSGKPYAAIKVPGGQAGVTSTPFAYTPDSAGDTLAAWIQTSLHPLDAPTAPRTVSELKAFFEISAGYVQRSVAFGIEDEYRHAMRYEQRDQSALMQLELQCTDCPEGWTIAVVADDPQDPLQFQPLSPTTPNLIVAVHRMIPAGYTDTLTLQIRTNGVPAPATARVDLALSLVVLDAGRSGGTGGNWQPKPFRLGSHTWRAQPLANNASPHGMTH